MYPVNSIALNGYVYKEPKVSMFGETHIINFTLRTLLYVGKGKGYTNPNTGVTGDGDSMFINCAVFNQPHFLEHLQDRASIDVMGELQLEKYKNKEGTEIKQMKIKVKDIAFKQAGQTTQQSKPPIKKAAPVKPQLDDEIPF